MSDAVSSTRKRSSEADSQTSTITNEYCGFMPPEGVHRLMDYISPAISPQEFFVEYAEKRRPAVFDGLLADDEWRGDRWTVPYLCHRAGNATIIVEDQPKSDANSRAMSGTFHEMQYRDFVSSMIAGDTRYQLTNNDVQCSMSDLRYHNGFVSTVLQPLHSLADDFPLRPQVMGHLIPHQVIHYSLHQFESHNFVTTCLENLQMSGILPSASGLTKSRIFVSV